MCIYVHCKSKLILICTDHNKLFDLAYENVKGDEKVLDSHIWALHPQITTEHLRTYITRKKEPVKILRAFLEVVSWFSTSWYLVFVSI